MIADEKGDPIELPINCPDCGGKLRACVGPPDPNAKPATWVCPYCAKGQTVDFGGSLIFIVKRHVSWVTWA